MNKVHSRFPAHHAPLITDTYTHPVTLPILKVHSSIDHCHFSWFPFLSSTGPRFLFPWWLRVLLWCLTTFNLGDATYDGGHTGWLEWFSMPDHSSPSWVAMYIGMEAMPGKRKENLEEEAEGGTMWCSLAPERALVPGQLAHTDSLSSSPSTETALFGWQLSYCWQRSVSWSKSVSLLEGFRKCFACF